MAQKTIRSASHRRTNDLVYQLIADHLGESNRILDFGSGAGHMCQRLGNQVEAQGGTPSEQIYACEINPEAFQYDKIPCQKISSDSEIPFPDEHFDVIYAIEVIEHTPRPYDLFKIAYKKLRPGGKFLITTPNLLHMKSRIEYLFTGFGDMYPPPSSLEKNAGRICGHIMPLNLSYFAYGARKAGFEEPVFHVDRRKRSSGFLATALWPLMKLSSALYDRKIRNYDLEDWNENKRIIRQMNSFDLLTSRSCILSMIKPSH
jgi:SAM-dependent methyltransferase